MATVTFTRDHTFRTIAPEDFGRWPIRFTEIEATWFGREIKLPPMDDRHSPDQYAAIGLWLFDLPHAHILTERYALCLVELRDIRGVRPAYKFRPDMTHELIFLAVNPDTPEEMWARGEYRMLTPVNYTAQFKTPFPHAAKWIGERCAEAFVDARFIVEPQGIGGAMKFFRQSVEEWERQSVRIFDGRGPKSKPGDAPEE